MNQSVKDRVEIINLINPKNLEELHVDDDNLKDIEGNVFPIIDNIPRFVTSDNYAANFGFQWNKFDKTQIDNDAQKVNLSQDRFFAETNWDPAEIDGLNILEVGCGAGRFTEVVLSHTKANLYSVDFSDAVTANFKNNSVIAPNRCHIFQASSYDLPFKDRSFDKVFCLGVLQHTPDFEKSIKALISKTKIGGEIVVDFYPINGWWSKIHAKYLLRPFSKNIPHERLLEIIENNVDKCIKINKFLRRFGLKKLARFVPICDITDSFPESLSKSDFRAWTVLDTFDQYSPEHDHPQRLKKVCKMFERNGADVTFSGRVFYGNGGDAVVVRGIRTK